MVLYTKSPEETRRLGERLAAVLPKNAVLCLEGDLGAGKTLLAGGILNGLGYEGYVTSPTFALVNEYETPSVRVRHFDLYRILDEDSLEDIGFFDALAAEGLTLIEWSENAGGSIPQDALRVRLSRGKTENERRIALTGVSL